jgi:uncharacterized protein DUF4175
MSETGLLLGRLAAPLRRLATFGWGLAALGVVVLGLGLAAWAARLGWFAEPWWVLVAWPLVAGGAVTLGVVLTRRGRALSAGWLASLLEAGGFREGALRAHLAPAAHGTSEELFRLADRRQAGELESAAAGSLDAIRGNLSRRARRGGVVLAAGALVFLSSRPLTGPAAMLWRPRLAWEATVAPLRLAVDHGEVDRGAQVAVFVEARGRQHAILWSRAPGEAWRGRGLTLDSLGQAREQIGPLSSDLFLRVTSGGRQSDTLQVKVRLPAFLGSLTVTARYPHYLGLEDEPVSTAGDTVVVPAGTRLETRGEATAPLRGARWDAGTISVPLSIGGSAFSGAFVPAGSRTYQLTLVTDGARPLVGDTIRIPVVAVPDSAPHVDVPVPGADTVAPLSLKVPLVVDVQDDHGVTQVTVESRRISRLGFADPARLENVPLPSAQSNRAVLTWEFDLNTRGLLPGDTVRYVVQARDNSPAGQTARSREYILRLPSLSEIREAARQGSEAVGRRLDSVAQASRQLERQTEDLAQERPRPSNNQAGAGEQSLSFENARRAESVAERSQQLLEQAQQVKDALEALRQSAEAAGLNDPEWMQRLAEIRDQLEQALTPELRQRLAELQRALQDLDPEQTKDALEKLAEAQQQLRDALERSRELFKRAATEGELANLSAEAKDLEEAQRQWNQQVPALDSTRASREEQANATRADSLGAALDQLSKQVGSEGQQRQDAVQQLGQKASNAARQMRQAAQSASRGQKQRAKQQGEQALQELGSLDDELNEQREQMQDQWRQEIIDAIDRALGETTQLAEHELDLSESFRRGDAGAGVRGEQGAVEEGVERLLEQMKDLSGKNALVSPGTAVALATARDLMTRSREALATAAPNTREAGRRSAEAVDALNAAAHSMIRSRSQVAGSSSGSGLAEAIEQMNQMAQQQGQMGQQSAGLLPMAGNGAMQEQIRQLGAQQRALAERLERLQAGGNMPGAGELSEEAKELARQLEGGRLDRPTVERQERLFRRMLDAGRTLQGHEEDERKERQSTTARDDSIHLPPSLRQKLGGDDALYRVPSWERLQALTPEERRLVVEYFRRLSQAGSGPR